MNSLLNGVLAIIRNAPERAREHFREANVKSVSDVYVAIYQAIEESNNKAKLECLRNILQRSLRITSDDENVITGITAIEKIIDEEIDKISQDDKTKATSGNNPGFR